LQNIFGKIIQTFYLEEGKYLIQFSRVHKITAESKRGLVFGYKNFRELNLPKVIFLFWYFSANSGWGPGVLENIKTFSLKYLYED
jgi:hypothetical protein